MFRPTTSSTKETELPAEYLKSSLAQQQQVSRIEHVK